MVPPLSVGGRLLWTVIGSLALVGLGFVLRCRLPAAPLATIPLPPSEGNWTLAFDTRNAFLWTDPGMPVRETNAGPEAYTLAGPLHIWDTKAERARATYLRDVKDVSRVAQSKSKRFIAVLDALGDCHIVD